MSKVLGCDIRWLIRRDMDEVLAIEQECFEWPWTEEEFLLTLRQRNCIALVAHSDNVIWGYVVYELYSGKIRILNLAVEPRCQRSGVGRQLVQRLVDKLSLQRRRKLEAEVRETNLDAQLFFAAQGFRATGVLTEHYDDTIEDAYLMKYFAKSAVGATAG